MNDLKVWQNQAVEQAERILQTVLPISQVAPQTLHEAMRYSTLDGGKRLRPLLVLAASELGNQVQAACEAAMAAVECIHVYSLVHDDMPVMDNDSLRRGKPTCHVQFGEATALLVGDALQTLAFDILSTETELSTARQLRMVKVLAQASGSLGMAGGQAVDLGNVGRDLSQTELEFMHSLKTGALIRAAVALGGLSCPDLNDEQLAHLDVYASKLGLAFQVIDDVLDCEADTATLGKTAGKDADANKPTYVKLMGLQAARAYAEQLVAQAIDALQTFDTRADHLRTLAQFVVARKS
ncbi:polyprenyl synthetase family protein [Kingella kingae]|uniref:polyprenyl synthetase family protein n=1 Tax=Kingella kingae TaxID=504 RepID=UPI0002584643|nr:farnesyl diphosphate synthase [Kingella kingae]EIC12738.1 geranyltranstransferase [Kingella kingae PYKK081]MBD3614736.1 polyprenyl synthetase family protein [Kingella kingae]MBD3633099.1 polyprenyl synthetase family protein [Kingella kingae]MBD3660410.1 polyprenyl synthetase family protein [Kingella kingae]MDK4526430.1 polyprenyl synthetase family protein [Kingella kingae]